MFFLFQVNMNIIFNNWRQLYIYIYILFYSYILYVKAEHVHILRDKNSPSFYNHKNLQKPRMSLYLRTFFLIKKLHKNLILKKN